MSTAPANPQSQPFLRRLRPPSARVRCGALASAARPAPLPATCAPTRAAAPLPCCCPDFSTPPPFPPPFAARPPFAAAPLPWAALPPSRPLPPCVCRDCGPLGARAAASRDAPALPPRGLFPPRGPSPRPPPIACTQKFVKLQSCTIAVPAPRLREADPPHNTAHDCNAPPPGNVPTLVPRHTRVSGSAHLRAGAPQLKATGGGGRSGYAQTGAMKQHRAAL